MAYKIGQMRKAENETEGYYMTNLLQTATVDRTGFVTKKYSYLGGLDPFEQLSIRGSFLKDNTYYIRFKIKRVGQNYYDINNAQTGTGFQDANNLGMQVFLFEAPRNSEGSIQPIVIEESTDSKVILTSQLIDSFTVGYKRDQINGGIVNSQYEYHAIVFKPQINADAIAFILNRQAYDFLIAPRNWLLQQNETNNNFELLEVSLVNNILPVTANKIGIQSRPGVLIMVNQQPVRIGRSGTYEVNNGVKITSFGIIAPNGYDPNNIDHFILDYTYSE